MTVNWFPGAGGTKPQPQKEVPEQKKRSLPPEWRPYKPPAYAPLYFLVEKDCTFHTPQDELVEAKAGDLVELSRYDLQVIPQECIPLGWKITRKSY